jgi:hypothetical protein
LGFGWIYSGNTNTGIIWLVGYLLFSIFAIVIDMASGGLACFCTIPVNVAAIIISATSLNKYIKAHPELFGM